MSRILAATCLLSGIALGIFIGAGYDYAPMNIYYTLPVPGVRVVAVPVHGGICANSDDVVIRGNHIIEYGGKPLTVNGVAINEVHHSN